MKKAHVLVSMVILGMTLFSFGSEAVVVEPPPYPLSAGVAAPPRECSIRAWEGVYVKIEAGPAESGGLSDTFPVPTTCPDGPCLQWKYRWIFPAGITPLEALASVDSDITVLVTDPSAEVSRIIPITAEGERFLKYAASGPQFTASYYTPPNVTAGSLTAGYVGKKSVLPVAGKCLLAGADNVVTQQNQAVADEQTYRMEGCTVAFKVASDNKVIPGTIRIVEESSGGTCTLSETFEPITVDGTPIIFVGAVQFTQEGSCKYCWTNTFGGSSCSTCTTCCVSKSTGKCVKTSSLQDPANQCKSGTYTP